MRKIFYVSKWAITAMATCLLLNVSIFAQDPVYNTLTEDDGLPSNDVYDLTVD